MTVIIVVKLKARLLVGGCFQLFSEAQICNHHRCVKKTKLKSADIDLS